MRLKELEVWPVQEAMFSKICAVLACTYVVPCLGAPGRNVSLVAVGSLLIGMTTACRDKVPWLSFQCISPRSLPPASKYHPGPQKEGRQAASKELFAANSGFLEPIMSSMRH
jgi:hypothetical protein